MFVWQNDWSKINEQWWLGLLSQQQRPSFFLTPQFQRAWAQQFAREIRVGLWSPNQQGPQALIAFHRMQDSWELVGGQDVADRLDALVAPDLEQQFWEELYRETQAWQSEIHFPNIDSARPLVAWADRFPASVLEQTDVSPYVKVENGFETYLEALSKKQRHEIRRKRRRCEELGQTYCQFVRTPADLERWFPDFVRLHRLSHPEKEKFMTEEMANFFHELLSQAAQAGWLNLGFILKSDKPIATMLQFDYAGTTQLYNSGFDPEYRDASPGFVLISRCIEEACRRGQKEYDFLRGSERYKYDLGGQDRQVFSVTWPSRTDNGQN